ncbi:MAG: thioredoxin fold domain-containing protein [Bacteroidales bacterium]|jgi:thioredoxin|nr:thioredoxin fold domain-containing protein [Bacteroidales bacterium]
MKKIISFAALALLISLSASVFAQKKPIEIGKKEFLTKVANYETNPTTWQYLGDKPAIIDFYADWCKPCKLVEQPLKELAKEYEGKIYIYKVNVDKHKDLAKEIGISSIPTMIFAPIGKDPQILMGAKSKEELKKYIDEILLGKEE